MGSRRSIFDLADIEERSRPGSVLPFASAGTVVCRLQALGLHDKGLDEAPAGIERLADSAHGVGHGGQRTRQGLERIALGLRVQRLSLAEALEHDRQ